MARYNDGFGIAFNDNDGGAAWFATAAGLEEYRRYAKQMGRLRAKLHFVRKMWTALKNTEHFADVGSEPLWKRLNGWTP